MKLIDKNVVKKLLAKDLKAGQLAKVIDNPYYGEIVLCTYDMIVSLSTDDCTWTQPCQLEVELLPIGYQITLEQTEIE